MLEITDELVRKCARAGHEKARQLFLWETPFDERHEVSRQDWDEVARAVLTEYIRQTVPKENA